MLDSGAKSFDDVTNAADLFEFVLQLVDLAEDFVHSSYFGVCDGHRIAGAVILQLRCSFALLIKLLGAKNGDKAVQVSHLGLSGFPDAFYHILAASRTRDLASRNRRALAGRESTKERLMGRTIAQRCWIAAMTRSKCSLRRCRLPGSSSSRPWLEALLAAREL